MRWRWQDVPGVLAAWAVALCALMVIVNPSPLLQALLAVLTPTVVLLAFLANLQQGMCPSCRAPRRLQSRIINQPSVRQASRTDSYQDEVGVTTGWDVLVPFTHTCGRCGASRSSAVTCFVTREQAASATEAELLAISQQS